LATLVDLGATGTARSRVSGGKALHLNTGIIDLRRFVVRAFGQTRRRSPSFARWSGPRLALSRSPSPNASAAESPLAPRGGFPLCAHRGGPNGANTYEFPMTSAARSSRISMLLRPRHQTSNCGVGRMDRPGVTSWSAVNGNLHLGRARPGLCAGDVVVLVAPLDDSQAISIGVFSRELEMQPV
jgi:hypothetical protein